jgi:hypothetical protein
MPYHKQESRDAIYLERSSLPERITAGPAMSTIENLVI